MQGIKLEQGSWLILILTNSGVETFGFMDYYQSQLM
jgi:hypothetical protein